MRWSHFFNPSSLLAAAIAVALLGTVFSEAAACSSLVNCLMNDCIRLGPFEITPWLPGFVATSGAIWMLSNQCNPLLKWLGRVSSVMLSMMAVLIPWTVWENSPATEMLRTKVSTDSVGPLLLISFSWLSPFFNLCMVEKLIKHFHTLSLLFILAVTMNFTYAVDEIGSSGSVVVKQHITFDTDLREYFMFVADGFQEGRLEIAELIDRIIHKSPPKTVLHLFACPAHRPICSFTVGDEPSAIRMRTASMKKPLAKAGPFFREPPENGSLQLDLPRVAASIASVRATPFPALVILAGDPVYDGSPHHQGFSMRQGVVPTFATLRKSSLSHLSPFFQGVKDMPKDALVTILAHDSQWGVDHVHQEAVEDFWRELFRKQGGAHLLRITASVESAFDLMRPQAMPNIKTIPVEEEFGMRPATILSAQENPEGIPLIVFLGRPRDKPVLFEVDPPTNAEEMFEKALKSQTHTLIAMRWNVDGSLLTFTDPDLHFSHPDFAEEMAYDNRRTPFAWLLKDIRYGVTLPGGDHPGDAFGENWEMVVVKNEYLDELEAWINVYCAVGGPIKINVVQIGAGIRKDAYYTLPVRFGDEATESKTRDQSQAWFRLPLPLQANEKFEPLSNSARVETKVPRQSAKTPPPTPTQPKVAARSAPVKPLQVVVPASQQEAPQVTPVVAKIVPSASRPEPATQPQVAKKKTFPKKTEAPTLRQQPAVRQVEPQRKQAIQPVVLAPQVLPWAWDENACPPIDY
ncbi:hypothetical protein [Bythopirellula goksoeyrii]|uniref:Uncharacterized protein n=1 Tax=Bythopirellula goksoeyrii TaxID=1400387 RepID=A0A5B9QDG4_9BACT|nr:hypothetical protein [Bythopirellula goksoeyrii]QEG35839.1 hypothetical protein Pr1d_31450 [Bythopirellula goksoeyrii]